MTFGDFIIYKMTFGDFIICYEHTFLRNIYTKEQINYSSVIKDLQSYYETSQKFIHILIGLISMLNHLISIQMIR